MYANNFNIVKNISIEELFFLSADIKRWYIAYQMPDINNKIKIIRHVSYVSTLHDFAKMGDHVYMLLIRCAQFEKDCLMMISIAISYNLNRSLKSLLCDFDVERQKVIETIIDSFTINSQSNVETFKIIINNSKIINKKSIKRHIIVELLSKCMDNKNTLYTYLIKKYKTIYCDNYYDIFMAHITCADDSANTYKCDLQYISTLSNSRLLYLREIIVDNEDITIEVNNSAMLELLKRRHDKKRNNLESNIKVKN